MVIENPSEEAMHNAEAHYHRECLDKEVLDFIRQYKSENGGASPSIREIGIHLGGKSTSNVMIILDRLERHNKIKRKRFKARGIDVLEPSQVWVSLRLDEHTAKLRRRIGELERAILETGGVYFHDRRGIVCIFCDQTIDSQHTHAKGCIFQEIKSRGMEEE
jgi:hypothetical protein